MKNCWKLPDIIDLEFFLQQDDQVERREGEEKLAERDRKIFLLRCAGLGKREKDEHKNKKNGMDHYNALLHCWLDARRGEYSTLPGRVWNEFYHTFTVLALFLGLLSGSGAALSLLTYSGSQPVNVSLYLFFFALLQVALLGFVIIILVVKRLYPKGAFHHPLLSLVSRLFLWSARALSKRFHGALRHDLHAVFGAVKARQELYSPISFWPFFILIQILAVGFNLGVLCTTLGKVTFSDVAFGWQTTLDISPDTAASIIGFLAAPWSWFMPAGSAVPSLSEIAGSRIILKDGLYRLATDNLVSWWPFLCMSVVFYGLIPRLLLLFAGRYSLCRAISGINLGTPCFRKIIRRMVHERISTEGESERQKDAGKTGVIGSGASFSLDKTGAADEPGQHNGADAIVLVPDDLEPMLSHVTALVEGAGFVCTALFVVDEECDIAAEPCGAAFKVRVQSSLDQVVIVREAWLPPLREMLEFIRKIRAVCGKGRVITVALAGRAKKDGRFEDADHAHIEIWRRQIAALGDPFVDVLALFSSKRGNERDGA